MQQWADITWADGQVWMASRYFIQNRTAAIEALNRADEHLPEPAAGIGRRATARPRPLRPGPRLRIAERARQGAGRISGRRRAASPSWPSSGPSNSKNRDAKDVYAWLATAEAPRRASPAGPGTPGHRPGFAPGDLDLPAAERTTAEPGADDDRSTTCSKASAKPATRTIRTSPIATKPANRRPADGRCRSRRRDRSDNAATQARTSSRRQLNSNL